MALLRRSTLHHYVLPVSAGSEMAEHRGSVFLLVADLKHIKVFGDGDD